MALHGTFSRNILICIFFVAIKKTALPCDCEKFDECGVKTCIDIDPLKNGNINRFICHDIFQYFLRAKNMLRYFPVQYCKQLPETETYNIQRRFVGLIALEGNLKSIKPNSGIKSDH